MPKLTQKSLVVSDPSLSPPVKCLSRAVQLSITIKGLLEQILESHQVYPSTSPIKFTSKRNESFSIQFCRYQVFPASSECRTSEDLPNKKQTVSKMGFLCQSQLETNSKSAPSYLNFQQPQGPWAKQVKQGRISDKWLGWDSARSNTITLFLLRPMLTFHGVYKQTCWDSYYKGVGRVFFLLFL